MKKLSLRNCLSLLLLYNFSSPIFTQIKNYNIPDSILLESNCVELNSEKEIEIFNTEKIIERVSFERLIVNNVSDNACNTIVIHQNSIEVVKSIEGGVYDTTGNLIHSIKKSDFNDIALNENNLATDDRVLYYTVIENNSTYIVKMKYEIEKKHSFNLEQFHICQAPEQKITAKRTELTFINHDTTNAITIQPLPPDMVRVESHIKNGRKITSYEINDISINTCQLLTESNKNILKFTLMNFQMGGFKGSNSSWSTFGDWILNINEGSDDLHKSFAKEIRNLVGNETDKNKIVNILYQYLQQNTRYVSIQLGIGGLKAMSANKVHETKYGDCKALSNYMKAMLKLFDIESNFVLIHRDHNRHFSLKDLNPGFYFNHMILTVNLNGKNLFLECTPHKFPAGYLDETTASKEALFLSRGNSHIVETPDSDYKSNHIINRFEYDITNETINTSQSLVYNGLNHNSFYSVQDYSDKEFLNHIQDHVFQDIYNLNILNKNKVGDTTFTWTASFKSRKYIQKSGNRYIMAMNEDKFPHWLNAKDLAGKKEKIEIRNGVTISETHSMAIPPNCTIEKTPKNLQFVNDSGELSINTEITANNLLTSIQYKIFNGIYDDNKLQLEEFWKKANKIKNEKIALVCSLQRP